MMATSSNESVRELRQQLRQPSPTDEPKSIATKLSASLFAILDSSSCQDEERKCW